MGQMITAELIREVAAYDPEAGRMTWKVKPSKHIAVGSEVGGIKRDGYRYVGIFGKCYAVHRLAWLYMTGEWPKHDIDHINGVRDDNRWTNLRDVTRSVNLQNRRKAFARSKSGMLGVCPNGPNWSAQIKEPGGAGKRLYLGTYKTKEEAFAVYVEAKRILHEGNTL